MLDTYRQKIDNLTGNIIIVILIITMATTITWTKTSDYYKGSFNEVPLNGNTKVAAFDLDNTLVQPLDGKKFSETDTDWEFYTKDVPTKVKQLYDDGYTIVIVSNQKGIGSGKVDSDKWCSKLNKIALVFGVPLLIFASIDDNMYRKPNTGFWDKFIKCDSKSSFYCGDAAGLPKRKINNIMIPKDFSDSDFKFALNVGVKFIHRDEFIYGVKQNPQINYPINFNNIKYGNYVFVPSHQEMIIMVGYPGSGKSFYTNNCILVNKQYVHINQDTLKTPSKCIKLCETGLKEKNSVVIDNTNSSKKSRKVYIDLAKKYGVKVRCCQFVTDVNVAKHNNCYRNWNYSSLVKEARNISIDKCKI